MRNVDFFDSLGYEVSYYGENFKKFTDKFNGVTQCFAKFQSNTSISCGKFCLWFLYYRSIGQSYKKIVNKLSLKNLRYNDSLVKKILRNVRFPKFSYCENCIDCDLENITSYCIQNNKSCYNIVQKLSK